MSELKVHHFVSIDELYQDDLYTCSGLPYYLKADADKVIAEKDAEIAKLKEESRWHKFCKEKPSEDMMGEEFIVNNGQYSTIAEWGEGYWENDPFCGSKICDEVVWWKYLDKTENVK